jgi:hypothetical protein
VCSTRLQAGQHTARRRTMGIDGASAQSGTLTANERDELVEYLRAGDMLAILKLKARRSLDLVRHEHIICRQQGLIGKHLDGSGPRDKGLSIGVFIV